MSAKLPILLFIICITTQLQGQLVYHYYNDINCLNRVTYKTSIKRDFYITEDSIFSRVFYQDTLRQEGSYYGFKSYKEIAPFEVFHKTQGLVELKQLKTEGRVAKIDFYEKGEKIKQVKFEAGETFILQIWIDGKEVLKNGSGSTTAVEGDSKVINEYKDYKQISGISIREEKGDTLHIHVDQAAVPPNGSIYGFHKDVKSTFKYPKKAKRSGAQATVYLAFIVDKSGKITELTVINKDSVDEAFVTLIENGAHLLKHWQPGYFKGRPVKIAYGVKLEFILK